MRKTGIVFVNAKSQLEVEEKDMSIVSENPNTPIVEESSSSMKYSETEDLVLDKSKEMITPESKTLELEKKPRERVERKAENFISFPSFPSLTDAFDLLDNDFFDTTRKANGKKVIVRKQTVKRIPSTKNLHNGLSEHQVQNYNKKVLSQDELSQEKAAKEGSNLEKGVKKENPKDENKSNEESNALTLMSYASEVLQTLPDRDILIRIVIAAVAGIAIFFTIFLQLGLLARH